MRPFGSERNAEMHPEHRRSDHNAGGLPEYMKLQLVEPLRELFKDEVRKHNFYYEVLIPRHEVDMATVRLASFSL